MQIGTIVNINTAEALEVLEQKLAALHEQKFETCQLNTSSLARPELWTEDNAEKIKALLKKYKITPSSMWCGWQGPRVWDFYEGPLTLGLVPVEYRQMRVQNLCNGADFAKKLGITDIVTHMGFIPENPNDPDFGGFCVAARTVAEHLKKNGQYLLFETGQETPVTLLRCFERIGTDNLGINLDTANLILYGKANPVDALDVFGKYVRNLHAKDGLYPINGHDLGREVKIGQGKVDFVALFQKLKELGYDSHVTIEREITGDQQMKDILEAREYLENIIKKVYRKD